MPRENTFKAFVLKKQPYGEGDEIITFYTLENGKIRALAKSTKFAKSKLQYSLQGFFLVDITLTGSGGLPKIIYAQAQETYPKLRDNLEALEIAFYATELLMKFTVDEEQNEGLFNVYRQLLMVLNTALEKELLAIVLAKFKIELLEALGFGVHFEQDFLTVPNIGFSNSKGGFGIRESIDLKPVHPSTVQMFAAIKHMPWDMLTSEQVSQQYLDELQRLLSDFITYHLERDVKSEGYINML